MAQETYEKILDDLMEERANLDRMIDWVKGKLSKNDSGDPVTVEKLRSQWGEPTRFPGLRSDSFFKLTTQQAIKACLNIMKKPMTAKDITSALQAGGLTHKAKDLYQTVFPTLMRMKKSGEIDKLPDGNWGLSEWYNRKSSQPQGDEEK